MKLSIIIATNNRPTYLKRLLSSIPKHKNVETIVIPNNFGLSKARNLGSRKARGEYLAFIDDDAVASPSWVTNILAFIAKHKGVAIFGGPYTSINQSSIPGWIPAEITSKKLPYKQPHPINLGQEWLSGTNFVVKKSLLHKLGGFDENLGVKANSRGYGEETELQIRFSNAGYPVWYDPQIKVKHFFAIAKQNIRYLLTNQFRHGYFSRAVFQDLRVNTVKSTAGSILTHLATPQIPLKRRIYYLFAPMFYLAGSIWARLH